ncbi:MAG: nuclear transport factor 2 family protein [Syntrophales bacterium]|jgi:hypothetical protein|nr:nuclear transport factor 2 family protein [Syntrophales bacterium]
MSEKSIEERIKRLEDIHEIQLLRNSYSYYSNIDGTPERARKFADMFTETGEFDAGAGITKGREAIYQRIIVTRSQWLRFMHLTTNGTIEVNGDRATGKWTGLFPLIFSDSSKLQWGCNVYNDEYVRTEEGWKFQSIISEAIFFVEDWYKMYPAFRDLNKGCVVATL